VIYADVPHYKELDDLVVETKSFTSNNFQKTGGFFPVSN